MTVAPESQNHAAETTIRETARAAAIDVADLAATADGDIGGSTARVADKLSEELAELGQMVRALPSRPVTMSGHDFQLLCALRTAHAAGEDVAETIARACARLAYELGGAELVLQNRPGSWEASFLRDLIEGTVGYDENHYRVTQP